MFLEPAIIIFADKPSTLRAYKVNIGITEPEVKEGSEQDAGEDIRSLLGRDVIDRWRTNYDPCKNRLECEVVNADLTEEVKPAHQQVLEKRFSPSPGAV